MAEDMYTAGPQTFSHLFPVSAEDQQTLTSSSSDDSPLVRDNAGVDYVIVFRFPTNEKDLGLQSRVEASLTRLLNNLSRVGLRYQVKPGRSSNTLLVLVGCPLTTLREELERERIRDFLLGIRVRGLDDNDDDAGFADINDLTEAERLRIVYEILTSPEADGGANISPNVDPFIDSIMALHNDEFEKHLVRSWSRKWLINNEDLLHIRNHFGEKIAFYFAFLQNYFLWLGAPAVLGTSITILGFNPLSPWFSLAMLLWSIIFIEVWKRKEQELAVQWNVRNCSKHERRRLEFKGEKTARDQVTGEEVPFRPAYEIFMRRAMSIPGVAIGAVLLSVIVACVFILQLFLHEYYTGPFHQYLHYTPTIGYVLLIPTMTNIYSAWMRMLNNYEMHKTETSWDYHYTQKIFIANFLVAYLSLFFIAWIYIPFGDHVLPYLTELNVSHSHEKVDFQRLRGQLVYFIVTGQIVGFATEMLLPYALKLVMPKIKSIFSKNGKTDVRSNTSGNEPDSKFMEKIYKEVDLPEYNIYTDYVEMVIQYGYVSMFSSVWPLTALCCMVNDWIELRGDAVKVCRYTRRPIPSRAEGAGPWVGNLVGRL
ncbi:calcium-activated chloride channel-domain-containing protein [Dichotomocladium elegans]|nr:calcium-activated chloride channel-domain-containing protein [Dichotomocladium elegans]